MKTKYYLLYIVTVTVTVTSPNFKFIEFNYGKTRLCAHEERLFGCGFVKQSTVIFYLLGS